MPSFQLHVTKLDVADIDTNKDQQYLYKMCKAIEVGEMTKSLAKKSLAFWFILDGYQQQIEFFACMLQVHCNLAVSFSF